MENGAPQRLTTPRTTAVWPRSARLRTTRKATFFGKAGPLDFQEEREIAQLRRLWESIELEIVRVLEASNQLQESPDYELHRLTENNPAVFDETVTRHIEKLETELALLGTEASELAKEIEELTGEVETNIV